MDDNRLADGMTLREWAELFSADDGGPIEALMGILQIMLGGYHGKEPSEDQVYCSCAKWIEIFGQPTKENIDKWISDSSNLFDVVVPNSVAAMAVGMERSDVDTDRTSANAPALESADQPHPVPSV